MSEETDLKSKVEKWINSEGLSLEYFTSLTFKKRGFRTFQSDFVDDNGTPREIDVLAYKDYLVGSSLFRLSCILECKWSKDKPWIVFTGEDSIMASCACIAQSLGNNTGSALLWLVAGEKQLHDTELFVEKNCGFSGRQAFTKDSDLFYSTIQAIINKTIIHLDEYNQDVKDPLEIISIGFPVIVIDGALFESYFEDNQVKVREVKYTNINWRGSNKWKFNSSVKIVTKDYLPEWVENLEKEFNLINEVSKTHIEDLRNAYLKRNLDGLKPTEGPRGYVGLPEFLRKIKESDIGLW